MNSGRLKRTAMATIDRCSMWKSYIRKKKFPHQHCKHRFSSTKNERRDREMCCLISRWHDTMEPASASAWPVGTGRMLGGHEGRRRKVKVVRAPDVSSEIAYAAIEGEVATLPTVLGHHRDRRRRRLEHHLEGGDHPSGGGVSARLRPLSATYVPLRSLVRGERIFEVCIRGSRARFRDGLRYERQRSFSRSSAKNGLCLARIGGKKIVSDRD